MTAVYDMAARALGRHEFGPLGLPKPIAGTLWRVSPFQRQPWL